jgi:hypothetical protein
VRAAEFHFCPWTCVSGEVRIRTCLICWMVVRHNGTPLHHVAPCDEPVRNAAWPLHKALGRGAWFTASVSRSAFLSILSFFICHKLAQRGILCHA